MFEKAKLELEQQYKKAIQIIENMEAQGASEKEVDDFLKELGKTVLFNEILLDIEIKIKKEEKNNTLQEIFEFIAAECPAIDSCVKSDGDKLTALKKLVCKEYGCTFDYFISTGKTGVKVRLISIENNLKKQYQYF